MPPFHEEQSLYRHALTNRDKHITTDKSRTQHKLQLQRLSFLTNDKNYLDHPHNMRRLTRELDRVEREYQSVRRYQDPVKESFKRLLLEKQQGTATVSIHSSSSSSEKGSNSSSTSSSLNSDYIDTKSSFLSRWFSESSSSMKQQRQVAKH